MLLRIVGPEWEMYRGDVEKVVVPTAQWRYAFLPRHENLVTPLIAGDVAFLPVHIADSSLDSFRDYTQTMMIDGGLCTVEDDIVTIVLA